MCLRCYPLQWIEFEQSWTIDDVISDNVSLSILCCILTKYLGTTLLWTPLETAENILISEVSPFQEYIVLYLSGTLDSVLIEEVLVALSYGYPWFT